MAVLYYRDLANNRWVPLTVSGTGQAPPEVSVSPTPPSDADLQLWVDTGVDDLIPPPSAITFSVVDDVVEIPYLGIAAGSKVLNSGSAVFSADDVGKTIVVRNAGPGLAPLVTTIATYSSATRVTLAVAAGTTRDGTDGYMGTDNAATVQANAILTEGDTLLLPKGKWLTSWLPTVQSRTAWQGHGQATSIFWASTDHAIKGHDLWHVRLSDFRLIGPARGLHQPQSGDAVQPQTADGVRFTKTGTDASNAATFYIELERIVVEKFSRDGFSLDTPIVSNIRECVVYKTGRHGFYLYGTGDAAGTSTHVDACFAAGCYEAGFYIKQMAYCTISASAADACGIGYWYNNALGLTENGCGTEEPYDFYQTGHTNSEYARGYSRRIMNGKVTQNNPYMIMNIGVSELITDVSRVVINSFYEGSPGNASSPVNSPTYSLKVEDGCFVTLNESQFTTPMDLAPGTTVIPRTDIAAALTPAEVVAGTNVTVDRTTTPGSVILSATGGTGSGTSLGSKYVNVMDHGAKGDGVTDDTTAIKAAITAAGVGGTVYFPFTSESYLVDPLKPLSYQIWEGQHSLRYNWDSTQKGGSILRAKATNSTAVIYNDNTTTNGQATQASRGVTIRNLGIYGGASASARTARGIDFGQAAGPERGWLVTNCQFAFCTTGIAGYGWACQIVSNHITRCGYGISPHRGVDATSRFNDCVVTHNFIYFNLNHAIEFGGSVESGLSTIAFNRVERSGARITGTATYDPTGAPDDAFACGIYLTRAHAITIVGNTSDANTGPGLCIEAAAHGAVNTIQSLGNVWKRDGIGTNDGAARLPGVRVKDTTFCQFRDSVTYGDPNDAGAGVIAPYYGMEYEANDWLMWDGSVALEGNTNLRTNGYRAVGTANWMCTVTDARQPMLGVPYGSTSSAPVNPQMGSLYYDTSLDALMVWDGSAWDSMAGSGGGGVTDHGALTGLADDDHPQYAKKTSVMKSIVDYGADPTGVAASDAAFAAFMNDATTSAVRVPQGNYKITAPIVMKSGKEMHGDHAARDSGETTPGSIITQHTNTAEIITGTDIRGVTLTNLLLTVASKANHTADGIHFTRSANPATNYVTLTDVHVHGPGRDGIAMSNLIVSAWQGVNVVNSGRHGFFLYGVENGAAGTSVSMDACYANTCGAKEVGHGFNIRKMTYVALTGCASEGNTGSAYYVAKSQGISLAGCGAEAPFGPNSFHVAEGSLGVVLNACWTYGNNGVAFDVDGASVATLIGCTEMDPTGTPVASFRTGTGTKVTLIDPTGYTARALDSSTVLIGNAAGEVEASVVKGTTVQGDAVVAKRTSGVAILATDRPSAGVNSQIEFRTAGATTNGWALTHLATSNNLRLWNFNGSKNALVLDSAGTYVDVVTKRIINVSDPTAATDATTKQYVDGRIWSGTQAQYDAIVTKDPAVLYVIV